MAPSWGAGPKHRRRDPLWLIVLTVLLAAALGTGVGYLWPTCDVGAPWWCW